MALILDSTIVEGLTDTLNFRGQLELTTVSAGTKTLSLASPMNQVFSGSTAGQIVSLGDASNYDTGQEFWVYNESTTFISIRDNGGTVLLLLAPSYRIRLVLKDDTTSSGIWIFGLLVSTSAGGTLVAIFADTASNINNKFLSTENVATSDTLPAVAARSALLNLVTYTNTNNVSSGTIEIRVNTTVGAAAASIPFTTTAQTFTSIVSVNVVSGDKINVKIANGASGVSKPLVKIYSA